MHARALHSLRPLVLLATLLATTLPAAAQARAARQERAVQKDRAAQKDSANRKDRAGRKVSKDTVAGGTHWRIETSNGPIHVWQPPGYDSKTAGTVVYVHGYWVHVDEAWKRNKLAQQFRKSRQNALFVVPEAPSSNEDRVYWDSLGDLKKAVRRAGIALPDGPTIAVAHSGGFRTIAQWVDNKLLAQVILLDALYGKQNAFDDFIHSGKRAQHHKMIIVASDTLEQSRAFAKKFRFAVVFDKIPDTYAQLEKRARRAKLIYMRSQYGHGNIVDGGKVIPLMLRLTPLKKL